MLSSKSFIPKVSFRCEFESTMIRPRMPLQVYYYAWLIASFRFYLGLHVIAPARRQEAMQELNLFAPIILVQEFVHLHIASKDGRIANVGSVSGLIPLPFSAAYNASKAALHAFWEYSQG